MKKLTLLFIGLLLIPSLFLTSCDRGDDISDGPVATPAFTLLKDHLVTNDMDLDKILTSFVAAAPAEADLNAFLAKYYILDIRSSADFTNGHIQGAKNITFSNILTEAANSGGKPILMVCYTGQTACYATGLLRLYGFSSAQALKWGMSGWNSANAGPWNNNIGDIAMGNANWNYENATANNVYKDPIISSFSADGTEILKKRVEQIVADGFKTVSGADVLANPGNYFVNNFFNVNDYKNFGHIDNAYRINPLLLIDNSYQGLDSDGNTKVVTYCYTGQTSAIITAYLRVLGYNAYSLSFGMNGLYNSNDAWTTNKWSTSVPKNLAVVQ